MCGIAGSVRWGGIRGDGGVRAMTEALRHRGPDDGDLWCSLDGNCVLGHRRLSVIDLSPAGHQPMVDRQTGNVITFNGEIFNFLELRRTCEAEGEQLTSHSDTEVILALYRRHGIDCLQLLRGMFALAIWDPTKQRLLLARDRMGKKPLNYVLVDDGVSFSSELRGLSMHPDADSTLDPEALELYLQCQFIPAPWTIYRGIRKLPPAHYAILDRTGFKIARYWAIDYRRKRVIKEADALDELEDKLTEAVRLRMTSDVPLGALLSGGVDSSLIVALMAKVSAQPVRTFSIGFDEEAYNELPWAAQASETCATLHHPEIVRGDVQALLPRIAQHYGEPFADSSAVPSFIVAAAARRHVTVALNGDGGDELLGGYPRYWLPKGALLASHTLGRWISPEWLASVSPHLMRTSSIPGRVIRKLLMQYVSPEVQSLVMFAAFWNDRDRRELFPDGPASILSDWRRDWLDEAFAHAKTPVDRMLWLDNHTYLPGDLLTKMDIASMHCGLETRSPLLDHEVVEFCAALPTKLKVAHRTGKYLLKQLAQRYFPPSFVHRKKMGFGIPLAQWLRGSLKGTMKEVLLDEGLMAPMSMPVIARTLDEFEAGHGAHESRLWALLMFGVWRTQQSSGRSAAELVMAGNTEYASRPRTYGSNLNAAS